MVVAIISIIGFISTTSLVIIVQSIFIISSINQCFSKDAAVTITKTGDIIDRSVRISSIAVYLSVALWVFTIFCRGMFDILTNNIHYTLNKSDMFFKIPQYFFMSAAYVSFHCYMLSKLYSSFISSAYAVKKYVIYVHILTMFFIIFSWALMIVLVVFDFVHAFVGNVIFSLIWLSMISPIIHLLYAFNSRLFKLARFQQQSMYKSNCDRSTRSFSLSKSQETLLSVARKATLLTMVILFTGIVSMISYVIATNATNGEYKLFYSYIYGEWFIFIFDLIWSLCVVCGCFCIYLSFGDKERLYLIVCKQMDSKCKTLCEFIAKQRFEKDEQMMADVVRCTSDATSATGQCDCDKNNVNTNKITIPLPKMVKVESCSSGRSADSAWTPNFTPDILDHNV